MRRSGPQRIRDMAPDWRPAWIVAEQWSREIPTRRWARAAGLTPAALRQVRTRADAPLTAVAAAARALGTSLVEILVRHGVRLDDADTGGEPLGQLRRDRGLEVRSVARAAGLHPRAVLALEGPAAGACSIDELGDYAAAVGLTLDAAFAALTGLPARRRRRGARS